MLKIGLKDDLGKIAENMKGEETTLDTKIDTMATLEEEDDEEESDLEEIELDFNTVQNLIHRDIKNGKPALLGEDDYESYITQVQVYITSFFFLFFFM